MLIVFEGIDGCGKTTTAGAVAAYLRQLGHNPLVTAELGRQHVWSEVMRDELVEANGHMRTEYDIFTTARHLHHINVLGPAMAKGQLVLMDRYVLSTIGYQCQSGQEDAPTVQEVLEDHTRNQWPIPDLTVFLACPYHVARDRCAARGHADNFESRGAPFFMEAHSTMSSFMHTRRRLQPHNYLILDAQLELSTVIEQAIAAVTRFIQNNPELLRGRAA